MATQTVDQGELKQKLLANQISWQDALALITSSNSPPWKTKEWKLKRDSLIATVCGQCGSSEAPLVLQHTWQPKPLVQLFRDIRADYSNEWNVWKEKYPISIDLSNIPLDANVCPKCFSQTIKFRKTLKNWKCLAQESGVFCHHIFETPICRVSKDVFKALEKEAWKKQLEAFDTAFGIGVKAVLAAIDQHTRYLSMKDTITLCKRCAFVADKTKLVLCNICKENYHKPHYSRCAKCAGFEVSNHT